jgi:hypothetical protein
MGYTAIHNTCTTGTLEVRKLLRLNNGETYVKTNRKDIEIVSLSGKFSIVPEFKKVRLNICSYYKEDSVCYVSVYKGMIKLKFKNWNYGLMEGQYAKITDTIQIVNMSGYEFRLEMDRSWTKKGNYQFINKPLFTVINRIARVHGYNVRYLRKPVTLVSGELPFFRWTSIETQLRSLSSLVRFECYEDGNTLVIK